MKLTEAVKSHLVELGLVETNASDDEMRKAAGVALATGTLSVDKYAELTAEPKSETPDFESRFERLEKGLEAITSLITQQSEKAQETKVEPPKEETKDEMAEWKSKVLGSMSGSTSDPDKAAGDDVRVKGAWERYTTTKSTAVYPQVNKAGKPHPKAGQPIRWFSDHGYTMDAPSDLEKAVAGAYCKFLCAQSLRGRSKTLAFLSLNPHDQELLRYGMEKMAWGGSSDGGDFADIKGRPLTPHEQKALIDDAVSGGLEAAPIVFDDMVIQTPLLNGELFPLVRIVPLDRGRRIEGVATGTVTSSWGGIDDTAITLFNTTSYVSAFDTTIYRWEGAIRIGLDFLSDTPIDFVSHVAAQYGERLLEDLDDVIATGNGTTQPAGIHAAAGTSVTFGGVTSISNYESLRFGVAKPEHQGGFSSTAVFCGNETSYARARGIPVGASDARRIFGLDYDSYELMQRPYKINESLQNEEIFYAILGRYRMYQRRGLVMRSSTEGDTLIRNNEMLMVAMARYGGQLERGACAAATSDAPA